MKTTTNTIKKHLLRLYGWIVSILGVSIILLDILYLSRFSIVWFDNLLNTIGTSLFCSGLLTIIIGLKDWKEYFSESVKDIIIRQEYLCKLSTEDLLEIQKKALKVRFDNNDIGSEDSFWDFFNSSLQPLVSTPYRENVQQNIIIKSIDSEGNMEIEDTVSYICKSNGGSIQRQLSFEYDPHEAVGLKYEVTIKFPHNHNNAGQEEILLEHSEEENNTSNSTRKLEYDLGNYSNVNNLIVTNKSTYRSNIKNIMTWRMSCLTKNFSFDIFFPKDYQMSFHSFSLNPEFESHIKSEGIYHFKYQSWMFPYGGIAWHLYKKEPECIE